MLSGASKQQADWLIGEYSVINWWCVLLSVVMMSSVANQSAMVTVIGVIWLAIQLKIRWGWVSHHPGLMFTLSFCKMSLLFQIDDQNDNSEEQCSQNSNKTLNWHFRLLRCYSVFITPRLQQCWIVALCHCLVLSRSEGISSSLEAITVYFKTKHPYLFLRKNKQNIFLPWKFIFTTWSPKCMFSSDLFILGLL